MKLDYKIEYNHTYKEYLNEIKPDSKNYIKLSLNEVQAFDEKYHAFSVDNITKKKIYQYRILNNKTWWFIDNFFYEVK